MSTSAHPVTTQAPALLVVTDLGATPNSERVGSFFHHMASLFTFTVEVAILGGEGRYSDFLRREVDVGTYETVSNFVDARIGRLGVRRISLASPLETVLVAITKDLAPVGYVVGGMLMFERAVKLLMQWQRHRAELLLKQPPEAEPSVRIVHELTEGMQVHPPVKGQVVAVQDVEYLLRWAPIVRVERIDGPSASSED